MRVLLTQGDPKKHSIVYNGEYKGAKVSFYIPKVWLVELGTPKEIEVSLEGRK